MVNDLLFPLKSYSYRKNIDWINSTLSTTFGNMNRLSSGKKVPRVTVLFRFILSTLTTFLSFFRKQMKSWWVKYSCFWVVFNSRYSMEHLLILIPLANWKKQNKPKYHLMHEIYVSIKGNCLQSKINQYLEQCIAAYA